MKTEIIELYSGREAAALAVKKRVWTIIAAIIAALTVVVCVYLCLRADPQNAQRQYLRTVIAFVLGGWIVITLQRFVIADIRYALDHVAAMLEGSRETIDGRFSMSDKVVRIKKAISVRDVDIVSDMRMNSVRIYDKKAPLFDEKKARRVFCVHGFIAAYEVDDDAAD